MTSSWQSRKPQFSSHRRRSESRPGAVEALNAVPRRLSRSMAFFGFLMAPGGLLWRRVPSRKCGVYRSLYLPRLPLDGPGDLTQTHRCARGTAAAPRVSMTSQRRVLVVLAWSKQATASWTGCLCHGGPVCHAVSQARPGKFRRLPESGGLGGEGARGVRAPCGGRESLAFVFFFLWCLVSERIPGFLLA